MSETRIILGRFTATEERQVRCCHSMDKYLYVGTGPDGILYRSIDGFMFSEFYKTGDYYVTSVCDYGNALFVGTSPNGYVLMHNFNTGNRFHYLTTGDYQVTTMVVHDEKLWVGTSPSGLVFSFDGVSWILEYDSYGGGVKKLVSDGDILYAFVDGNEFIPCLKDGKWILLDNGNSPFSISAFSKVTTSIPYLDKNQNFDVSFSCACVADGKLFFAPENKCNLYMYDGSSVGIVRQWDGDSIGAIENIGDEQLIVAVDDSLYVVSLSELTSDQSYGGERSSLGTPTLVGPSENFSGTQGISVEYGSNTVMSGMSGGLT